MYGKNDIQRIKDNVEENIGNKVMLTSRKGRKKTLVRLGVIESTYPSIFVIRLDRMNDFFSNERRVSYSYTDVLTKNVEMVLHNDKEVSIGEV